MVFGVILKTKNNKDWDDANINLLQYKKQNYENPHFWTAINNKQLRDNFFQDVYDKVIKAKNINISCNCIWRLINNY
jgi:hypothetical protein